MTSHIFFAKLISINCFIFAVRGECYCEEGPNFDMSLYALNEYYYHNTGDGCGGQEYYPSASSFLCPIK
jgi:hypothetical protein